MAQSKDTPKQPARSKQDVVEQPNHTPNGLSDDFVLTMISSDFEVVQIGSGEGQTLFGAQRKDLFHFICYTAGTGLRQYHVPHFRIADAVRKAEETPEEAIRYPLAEGLSLLVQKSGPLGLMAGDVCFLLSGTHGSAIAESMIHAAGILKASRNRVVPEKGIYLVTGAETQGGNPVSSESRLLMDGIAFERSSLRRLSAKRFGVYSAFCTHRDFPCALDKKSCLKEMLESHFEFYDEHPPSEDFLQVVMAVQDGFIGCRIWEPGKRMTMAKAIAPLAVALSKLDAVQRTQIVLLNGMHGGSILLHLALVIGMVSFDDYTQFRTASYQPDSEDEQMIRTSTSYIQLFGDLGSSTSERA
jgi:hypothetical protein